MNCGISDNQWADYLDRTLSPQEASRIESHLRSCRTCRAEIDVLRQVDQRLRIEFGLARQAMHLSFDRRAAQARVLAALNDEAMVSAPNGICERLWRVRWVLALLCGSNTATRIIQAAESHTCLTADAKVSEQKWLLFLRRLRFLTTEVCGCFAGELIWTVGR